MSSTVFAYPLDPTGHHPANRVEGEIHSLAPKRVRAIVPRYGPYYTASLVVYDHETGLALQRQTQYRCAELLQDATINYGQELCALILIVDPSVSATVRIDYQVLGGLYQNDVTVLSNLYEAVMSDNRPVDWQNVEDKPIAYPPTLHRHVLSDVYGWEPIVSALERVRSAIVLGNIPAFEALIDWVDDKLAAHQRHYDQLQAGTARAVGFHVLDHDNPHGVTKAQLGLGAVENLSVVTLAEVVHGTPVNKYLTHARFIEAVAAMGGIGSGGSGGGTTSGYTLIPSVTTVNEGFTVTFTVTTTGVADNTVLWWSVHHMGTKAVDFAAIGGQVVIVSQHGSFTINIVKEGEIEVDEAFAVQLHSGSLVGTVVATSDMVSIRDADVPSFHIPIKTTAELFTSTSVYDPGIIITPSSLYWLTANRPTVSTPGYRRKESATARVTNVPVTILPMDVKLTMLSDTAIDEGSIFLVALSGTHLGSNTGVYWFIRHDTTTDADFRQISGQVLWVDGYAAFIINTLRNPLETTDKTFRIDIRSDNDSALPILATSPELTIRNVTTPIPGYVWDISSWTVDTALTMLIPVHITTSNVTDQSYTWRIHSVNTVVSDFVTTEAVFSTVSNSANFTVTLASGIKLRVKSQFYIELLLADAVVATSNLITVISAVIPIAKVTDAMLLSVECLYDPSVIITAKSYYWVNNFGRRLFRDV